MQQDYGHCLNFADGDIFRHILNARGRGDLVCEKKWYARLKRWQKGHLTTVQHYYNSALLQVFMELSANMALVWHAFNFCKLRDIMQMHCEEVGFAPLRLEKCVDPNVGNLQWNYFSPSTLDRHARGRD